MVVAWPSKRDEFGGARAACVFCSRSILAFYDPVCARGMCMAKFLQQRLAFQYRRDCILTAAVFFKRCVAPLFAGLTMTIPGPLFIDGLRHGVRWGYMYMTVCASIPLTRRTKMPGRCFQGIQTNVSALHWHWGTGSRIIVLTNRGRNFGHYRIYFCEPSDGRLYRTSTCCDG